MTNTPHPISLSDAQMALIQQAAKALPAEQRTKFLEARDDV